MSDRRNVETTLRADWRRAQTRYDRWTRAEVDRFQETWPPIETEGEMFPEFSWAELERQLTAAADRPETAAIVPMLISATRKQAKFKPPELVLRELLCIAAVIMDESFRPPGREDEMT